MTLIGTGFVNTRTMHIRRGLLETCTQKAAVQFFSENGKKCELFVDYFSHSVLCIAAYLVVSSLPIYSIVVF